MPYVATHSSPPGKLYARGFHFTRDLLTTTLANRDLYQECGALQLPATKRLSRILTESSEFVHGIPIQRITAKEASERAGIAVPTPSFFIPQAGQCAPPEITKALIATSVTPITVRCSTRAVGLEARGTSWRVSCDGGDHFDSEVVILCGAHEITHLAQTSWVPLEAIRGQTAQVQASPVSSSLETIISYGGYITPANDGVHFVGAHYRHNDMNEEPTEQDTTEILSRLYRTLPTLLNLTTATSRVCFRASTHDRMPYIGELPSRDTHPPLFINAGHGSRGLVTGPMGGEILARLIHREPLEDLAESAAITSTGRLAKRSPHR
jgi:tRNA 5-methylaminomethyl-2-thiouridine biosynthesis bifunctional protein